MPARQDGARTSRAQAEGLADSIDLKARRASGVGGSGWAGGRTRAPAGCSSRPMRARATAPAPACGSSRCRSRRTRCGDRSRCSRHERVEQGRVRLFSFLHQPEPTRQAARHPQSLRQPASSSWITYFVMGAPGDSSGRDAHPPPRGRRADRRGTRRSRTRSEGGSGSRAAARSGSAHLPDCPGSPRPRSAHCRAGSACTGVRVRRPMKEGVGGRQLHLLAGVHHDDAVADLVRPDLRRPHHPRHALAGSSGSRGAHHPVHRLLRAARCRREVHARRAARAEPAALAEHRGGNEQTTHPDGD
jgi:hypothetical protein